MQTKINEIGRSMVEMLGVLAVIGVLSVAGILGYKFAMNKYIANETINELAIRANDIAYQMDKLIEANYAGEIEMELGNTTRMGYPIMARMSPQYEEYFEIFLSEVPSDICKLLLQSQWQSPYSIFVGIEEYEATPDICNSAEKVELAYEFYKDMRGKEEIPEDSRHEIDRCRHDNDCKCGTCSDGLCKSYCENEETCVLNYSDPKHFICCNPANTANGLCCVNQVSDGECCDENLNCCPADKPLRDKDGNCYACDEPGIIQVDSNPDSCYACPNRVLRIAGYGAKYCALPCGVKGTENENKPLLDIFGKCHACDEEINFVVMNREDCNLCSNRWTSTRFDGGFHCSICGVTGTKYADMPLLQYHDVCYSCDTPDSIPQFSIETAYKCKSVCPQRLVNGNYCLPGCPKEKPLKSAEDNQCYDCNYTGKVLTSGVSGGECSTVCTNRQAVMTQYDVEYCQLKECPTDKPLLDYFGACHSCDEEINFVVKNKEDCNQCSGRFATTRFDGGYWCSICGVAGTKYADMPLLHYQGSNTCYACDTPDSIPQFSIETAYKCKSVCPQRLVNGNYCLPGCPKEKPLKSAEDNQCYDCNYTGKVLTSGVSGGECSTVCTNRQAVMTQYDVEYCQLKECPTDKPLLDYFGACHSCDEEINFVVKNKEDCNQCSGRFATTRFDGGYWCSICGVAGTKYADMPLLHYQGSNTCYACNTPDTVPQYSIGSEYKCQNVCSNRKLNGNDCIRVSCTGDKKLLGSDNQCYECNISSPINVNGDKDRCAACVNRHIDGLYCVLN